MTTFLSFAPVYLPDTIIIHASHDDLDGVGCLALTNHLMHKALPRAQGVQHKKRCISAPTSNANVNRIIQDAINQLDDYPELHKVLLMTDISPNDPELIKELNLIHVSRKDVTLVLLDHHPTATHLNRYDWAYVHPTLGEGEKEELQSGTSLLMQWIDHQVNLSRVAVNTLTMRRFAEEVRRYDSWDWTRNDYATCAEHLNLLLFSTSSREFLARFADDISISLTAKEREIVTEAIRERDDYIDAAMAMAFPIRFNGMNVIATVAAKEISVLGNILSKQFSDTADAALIINPKQQRISMRTVKDTVNLGAFLVRDFGVANAGGHPMAAGANPLEWQKLMDAVRNKDKEVFVC